MNRYLNLIIFISFIFMAGCASLPIDVSKTESHFIGITGETRIDKAVSKDEEKHPGESGFYIIPSDMEAFVARAILIEAAQRSLDLQYYIVNDDLTVNILMERIISAADRGVRVRLLFDDLGTGLTNDQLWLFDSHPNIEVRLFNPVKERGKGLRRMMQAMGNLHQLDHRMHNKALIADNILGIVGGRNLSDEYFGANRNSNFADMDLMAAGPIVNDVSKSFDLYWNCKWAIPFDFLSSKKPDSEQAKKYIEVLQEKNERAKNSQYAVRLKESDFLNRITKGDISYSWAKGVVLYDLPEKISDEKVKNPDVYLLNQLIPLAKTVKSELILVAPYFVPGKNGMKTMDDLRKTGIDIKVFTNSLSSTDVVAVFSGYSKYRKTMLQKGIELYEMRFDPEKKGEKMRSRFMGSSHGGLHAKFYVFDRKAAFIGSRNLDNRSNMINTEIGIFVESPEIASKVGGLFDRLIRPQNAYRLSLSKDSSLTWITEDNGKETTYDSDPKVGFWRYLSEGFYSLLAPEAEL